MAVLAIACLWSALSPVSFTLPLSSLQATATEGLAYVERYPWRGLLLFALFYGVICMLPTPFISAFTMLAGYLFGNALGLLVVSFMSALGGTVLFLVVRYTLRNWVHTHWLGRSAWLQQAANADNLMAAFSLRLIVGLPFPVPAIALALSRLSVWKFYISTQLGLLITLAVYVNAGRSLAELDSLEGIISLQLILSLLLLAIVPWGLQWMHRRFFNTAS